MDESKIKTLEAEDRISTLPDAVICDILSLLYTKEAVRTSVLSTRWRYVFASVTTLRFYDSSSVKESGVDRGRKFTDFVNGVLNRHDISDISLLDLDLMFGCYEMTDINSWISFATHRNVRKIDVMVQNLMVGDGVRSLVPDLFTCKTLVDLFLCGVFGLYIPDFVDLPNLKTCFLRSNMKFIDDGSTQRLFSSCPKLEKLTLIGCDMKDLMDLELHIPSLKMFRFFKANANQILLDAPNLEYFEYSGCGPLVLCKDVCKSIVRADIGLERQYDSAQENMSLWANYLIEVKYLSLRSDTLGVLQRSCCLLPMFNNLTHLELQAHWESGWKLLPNLLHKTPCLEVLVIHYGFMDDYVYAEITESEPFCLSQQLKVAIVYVSIKDQSEFKWIKFLLKIGRVLEKLTVYPEPPKTIEDRFQWRDQIREEVLAFPRISENCQIEIQDKGFLYGGVF